MEVMLENGVIPIINENDTVCVTELMFTDNDELSGLVARMMNCDHLIILSNIDGIFTGNPDDPNSELITHVKPGDDLSRFILSKKSNAGRGGMESKYSIAQEVNNAGITVIIANGKRNNVLTDLLIERTKDKGLCTKDYVQRTMYKGLCTKDYVQRTMYKGQRTEDYVQRTKDKGQCNEWEQSFKILQIPDINKPLIKNRNEKSI